MRISSIQQNNTNFKAQMQLSGNVELINVKPKIKKIIEMAGILKIIAIKDNVQEQIG